MFFLQRFRVRFRYIFNLGVIVSAIIFGNIASLSIYEIIKDNTVFMTNIHSIFLNPFFLLTGGYLGIYILYRLIKLTIDDE
ncbi:transposase [Bacillus sp. MUM 116]|nr:transposase [Bacillus sp. MUM 116]